MTTRFVASPSRPSELLNGLSEAVGRANAHLRTDLYHMWVKNDVVGRALTTPIHEKISSSELIVADVTTLNLNVTYEIGYAIGQGKRVLITRSRQIKGDIQLADEIGIFDTLGRYEYHSFEDLTAYLCMPHDVRGIGIDFPLDNVKRLFFLDIPGSSDAIRHLVSAVKEKYRLYRSFSDYEATRLSASFAIESVAASCGVIIPFLSEAFDGAEIHNYRAMFTAGLAHGMDRPTLILKDAAVSAPLDIRDSCSDYQQPGDIDRLVYKFRTETDKAFERLSGRPRTALNTLQRLSIGDPAAENEFTTLHAYYIPVDAYGRTLQGNVDLVTGRKGSGKTALFYQVRDSLRRNSQNVVVDLKPEGYQLTQLKETVLRFLQPGSQNYLITSFWHYILLLEVIHRLIEVDRRRHKNDHNLHELYLQLSAVYEQSDVELDGDFSQRLLILTRSITERYKAAAFESGSPLTGSEIAKILYTHDIRKLEALLSQYLRRKDSVWVLFDNLDKGWSAGGVSAEDVVIARCLIEAAKKIKREFVNKGVDFKAVVFIRNDVYELLMSGTADYGKETRVNLDWNDRRQLSELLRRRLEFGGKEFEGKSIHEIWTSIFEHPTVPTVTVESLIEMSLLRPRNLIQLFHHCKGFAVNVGHALISEEDVQNALEAYSRDLVTEINREIADVFPKATKLLYDFMSEPSKISHEDLLVLCELRQMEGEVAEQIIELLLYYGFLGIPNRNGDVIYIYNAQYDMEIIKALARKSGRTPSYEVHQAFWPVLRIEPAPDTASTQPELPFANPGISISEGSESPPTSD